MTKMLDVRVIFFDAAGTLFHVKGSVGEIYSRIAVNYGIESRPDETEKLFVDAFRRKSAEGIEPEDAMVPEAAEKSWWMDIVRGVFAGRMDDLSLRAYFEEVFEFFRSAEAWELYPETRRAMKDLRSRGLRLAIISNFDSRLFDIVDNIGIGTLLENVFISWRARAAKPDAALFREAFEGMKVAPRHALHVGDSLREDYQGARDAGLHAVLLDRRGFYTGGGGIPTIRSLDELKEYFT